MRTKDDFERVLLPEAARRAGVSLDEVRELVSEGLISFSGANYYAPLVDPDEVVEALRRRQKYRPRPNSTTE